MRNPRTGPAVADLVVARGTPRGETAARPARKWPGTGHSELGDMRAATDAAGTAASRKYSALGSKPLWNAGRAA